MWLRTALVVAAVAAGLFACPAPCRPETCTGCCDAVTGDCFEGTQRLACGRGGEECATCARGEACVESRCAPPPDAGPPDAGSCRCTTCCFPDGGCGAGNLPEACGPAGAACAECAAGDRCDRGACTQASCGGCIDAMGQCQPGRADTACGNDGGLCVGCPAGQRCAAGACESNWCTAASCSTGCCLSATRCLIPPTTANCGTAGMQCVACPGATQCVSGSCT